MLLLYCYCIVDFRTRRNTKAELYFIIRFSRDDDGKQDHLEEGEGRKVILYLAQRPLLSIEVPL